MEARLGTAARENGSVMADADRAKASGSRRSTRQRGLRHHLARCAWAVLDLLVPPRCTACGVSLEESAPPQIMLCPACRDLLGPRHWPHCRRCGAHVQDDEGAETCPWCQRHALSFDAAIPLGEYQGDLRKHVIRSKRPADEPLTRALGQLWADRRGEEASPWKPALVVPVPMHWLRRLMRGINGPEVLARAMGAALGIPVTPGVLFRRRNTGRQTGLPPGQRFRNLRDAFAVRPGCDVRGKTVMLVDDVLTTGATCSAAAEVLRRAGAAHVIAAVVARAEGHHAT